MPNTQTHHPDYHHLASFARGQLAPDLRTSIQQHLLGCRSCRLLIERAESKSQAGPTRGTPTGVATMAPQARSTTPAGVDPPPELVSSSKYEIQGKLGQGGMGSVWRARHVFLDCTVAIKVLHPEAVMDATARDRFTKEMRAAGCLQHPNVVRALDAETLGDLLILVMEYVEGVSLDRLVRKKGPLPVGFACHCIVQAARGLQHAHEKGLTHRDVKPANIMVSRGKEVKVLDFGLARLPRAAGSRGGPTLPQTFMGTPEYISPEQAADITQADTRSDIYGLGCTLFFLLTGKAPFRGTTIVDTVLAHVQDPPPPLDRFRDDVPNEVAAIVGRMLAKKPADRYQTPGAVAEALEPFVTRTAATVGVEDERAEGHEPGTLPQQHGDSPTISPEISWFRFGLACLGGLAVGILLISLALQISKRRPGEDDGSSTPTTTSPVVTVPSPAVLSPPPTNLAATPPPTLEPPGPVKGNVPAAFVEKQPSVTLLPRRIPISLRQPEKAYWAVEGGELIRQKGDPCRHVYFGDPEWADYDFSLETCREDEGGRFNMFTRTCAQIENCYCVVLTGLLPTKEKPKTAREVHVECRHNKEWIKPTLAKAAMTRPTMKEGWRKETWYGIRVSVRGDQGSVWIGGEKVLDFRAHHNVRGAVGICAQGRCRFRNIRILDPQGKPLMEGEPELRFQPVFVPPTRDPG